MRLSGRQGGFSLVEATVAAAVLLLACAGVTTTITAVQRAESSLAQRERVTAALAAERQRLAALPYFAQSSTQGASAVCLAGAVFPHARPELNTELAHYCVAASDGPPGSFVSFAEVEGVRVRRVARFACVTAADEHLLGVEELGAWAWQESREPPAACLVVTLSAQEGSRDASMELRRMVLEAAVDAPPASSPGGGSGA